MCSLQALGEGPSCHCELPVTLGVAGNPPASASVFILASSILSFKKTEMCVCVCVCLRVRERERERERERGERVHKCSWKSEESIEPPGVTVIGSCEPSYVGAENKTGVLCKSSRRS